MAKTEIERKFLVANEGWKPSVIKSAQIRDGLVAVYLGRKARVRIIDDQATIALKGQRNGLGHSEFEYAIPLSDAEEMLRTMCDVALRNFDTFGKTTFATWGNSGIEPDKGKGISSPGTYEASPMWPRNDGERQWNTMSDWTCR